MSSYLPNKYSALAIASLPPQERKRQTVFGLDQALALATKKKPDYWPYAFAALSAGVIGAGYYYIQKLKEELFIVEEALEEELLDREQARREHPSAVVQEDTADENEDEETSEEA